MLLKNRITSEFGQFRINTLLCASGFSLHAATICEAWQRSRLERLCRYITRPPIATKRLSIDGQGRVVYRYKHPLRDGSTHGVLEPLDFIARLAALVPRPGLNLTRFHGVFAPNFKLRKRIVPRRPGGTVDRDKPVAPGPGPGSAARRE